MAKQQDQNLGCIVIALLAIGFVAGRWTAPATPPPAPTATMAAQPFLAPAAADGAPAMLPGDDAAPRPAAAPAVPSSAADSVYYANCSEARAAGAAPIREGEPGYAPHLDRDGDGVACE